MDLKSHLRELIERHKADLAGYAWTSETDRWAELVFCLLNQCGPQQPENTRLAVTILQYLGLLEIEKLARLEDKDDEGPPVVRYILKHLGFSATDTTRAVALLARAAEVIQAN
jgi:hypothetical protein